MAITRLSRASRENDRAASSTARSTCSPLTNGSLSPMARTTREASPAPLVTPRTSAATPSSTTLPMIATVA